MVLTVIQEIKPHAFTPPMWPMNSKEFLNIRKKLDKTQKEIANLLGISLKAVCSYEQGWRTIPVHVERQLFFLFARKYHQTKNANCWELRSCPEEKRNLCPAWEFASGQFCWFISGNICESAAYTSWEKKMAVCRQCVVMKDVSELDTEADGS